MSNTADELGSILNRTALIEAVMDQVIEAYCRPRQTAYRFFMQVMLHSSTISLGTKAKLVAAIAQEVDFKINKDEIHKLISLRNGFAHHPLDSHPTFRFGVDAQIRYELAVITSSGSVKRTDRELALAEFNELHPRVLRSIYSLRDAVDSSVSLELTVELVRKLNLHSEAPLEKIPPHTPSAS
jgi:hypothetical protein